MDEINVILIQADWDNHLQKYTKKEKYVFDRGDGYWEGVSILPYEQNYFKQEKFPSLRSFFKEDYPELFL